MEILIKWIQCCVDPESNAPMLLLAPKAPDASTKVNKGVSILASSLDIAAINYATKKIEPPRMITHTLLYNALVACGARLEKVLMDEMVGQFLFAKLYFAQGDKKFVLNAGPCEAVYLAVKFNCRVYIDDKVFDVAEEIQKKNLEGDDADEILLKNLDSKKMPNT